MYISYMAKPEELSDIQWVLIEPLLPKPIVRADRKGRPRRSSREMMNGILWILRSGARWYDLQERGKFDLSECFIDATLVVAKKAAPV